MLQLENVNSCDLQCTKCFKIHTVFVPTYKKFYNFWGECPLIMNNLYKARLFKESDDSFEKNAFPNNHMCF